MSDTDMTDNDMPEMDTKGMDMNHDHEGMDMTGMDKEGMDTNNDDTETEGMDTENHDHGDGGFTFKFTPAEQEQTKEPTDCYAEFGPEFLDCWTGLQWECCVADDDDFFRTDVPNGDLFVNAFEDDDGSNLEYSSANGLQYNSTLSKNDIRALRKFVVIALVGYGIVSLVKRCCRRSSPEPPPEIECAADNDDDDDVELEPLV